jgi:head-tail adaptor
MAQAGTLRDRVTIYSPGPTTETAFGRKPTGPDTALETWARVQPIPAKTFFEDGKFYTKQPYRITLRYNSAPAFTAATRVEWNGIRITVASVTQDAKKTTLTLFGYGS